MTPTPDATISALRSTHDELAAAVTAVIGAYGYARKGRDYRRILGHYYRGAELSRVSPTRITSGSWRSRARS